MVRRRSGAKELLAVNLYNFFRQLFSSLFFFVTEAISSSMILERNIVKPSRHSEDGSGITWMPARMTGSALLRKRQRRKR